VLVGPDQFHAGLERLAIHDHQALRALPVGAENTLRRAIFVMVAEDPDAIGEQRRGNRIASAGLQRLAVPIKCEIVTRGNGKDWVLNDSVFVHDPPFWDA
jgi:hypothetical protein